MQCQHWKDGEGSCFKKAVPGSSFCFEHGGTRRPAELPSVPARPQRHPKQNKAPRRLT